MAQCIRRETWRGPNCRSAARTASDADRSGIQRILAADVQAALLSLPRLCGTRLEDIPNQVPYLSAPPASRLQLPPSAP
ncbi:MAG: hypothetical protein NTY29_06235, partial [Proteobacteria bacterium]|nr:hypothetical protein [Pseudomonadota bacterium]